MSSLQNKIQLVLCTQVACALSGKKGIRINFRCHNKYLWLFIDYNDQIDQIVFRSPQYIDNCNELDKPVKVDDVWPALEKISRIIECWFGSSDNISLTILSQNFATSTGFLSETKCDIDEQVELPCL